MSIRWTEQCVTEVVREMRAHNVAGGGHREATLDDLRKACEAVGLVVITKDVQDVIASNAEERRTRYEKAEARVTELESERDALSAQVEALSARVREVADDVLGIQAPDEDPLALCFSIAAAYHDKRIKLAASQPTAERATDEELACLAFTVDNPAAPGSKWTEGSDALHKQYAAIARAVAARVRAERCLVTRAVEMGWDIRVQENDIEGWNIGVHPSGQLDEQFVKNVAPADVPATLARMLGGGQ